MLLNMYNNTSAPRKRAKIMNRSVHNGVRKKLAISRWFAFWMDSPVRRFQNTWLYDINVCGRINPNELTRVDGIGFDLRTLHRARVCNRIIERSENVRGLQGLILRELQFWLFFFLSRLRNEMDRILRTSDLVSETLCRREATCVSRNATFAFSASNSDSWLSMIDSDDNKNGKSDATKREGERKIYNTSDTKDR